MRNLILYLVLLTAMSFAKGQTVAQQYAQLDEMPDSLEQYQALVKMTLFNSPDTALLTIKKGIARSMELGRYEIAADLFARYGIWHDVHGGNFDSVIHYNNLSKDLSLQIESRAGYANVLNNTGYAYSRRSMFKEALPLLQEALEIYDSLGMEQQKSSAALNLGIIYQTNGELDKAMQFYYNSMGDVIDTIGPNNYRQLSNIATILNRQGKYDSAILLYDKLIAYGEKVRNKRSIGIYHNNISTSYLEKGQHSKALWHSEQSYANKLALKDSIGLVSSLNTQSSIYQRMGQYQKSIETAFKALELNARVGIPKDNEELYKLLAESYQMAGQYKNSVNYYQKYIAFKDSLDQAQQAKEIADIMEKYEAVKRQEEISSLKIINQEAQLETERSANQRNTFMLVALALIVVTGFLFTLLRTKSKTNRLIEKSLKEKEILLREIHHRVKNNLQVISSLLSLQSRFVHDEAAKAAVNEGQNRVKSMALIHQKLYQHDNLMGVDLLDYVQSLVSGLKSAYAVEPDQVTVHYDVDQLRLDVDTIIPIGLILNELISNTFKYAFPDQSDGKLTISLKENQDQLILSVSDNGVGADENIDQNNSFGMRLIRSLSNKLDAEVSFVNEVGMTTTLNIKNYKLA